MAELPATAAWRLLGAHDGFEVVFVRPTAAGHRFDGHSTGAEDGVGWGVRYSIEVDPGWATRRARVESDSTGGDQQVQLVADGSGSWKIDGRSAPELDGCIDLDLEGSVLTNAFPLRRFALAVGESADAPAAYVRVPGLAVERLGQRYERLPDEDGRRRYDYQSPDFGYRNVLAYDERGLVFDYPGIAVRVL
jgi:uncharacterized protein